MTKTMTLLEQARELQAEIVETRRYIHQHPELSFEEVETSKLAAERLKDLGFTIIEGVARTGITADIGSGARTIAIRADMDALPLDEAKDRSYRSQNEGIMHACGHDAHVASALAAAKLLAREESLPGRVRMIMQPAEEDVDEDGRSGACRMIEEGAMEGVDAVIGLHMDASIPAGKVAIMHGPVMAAADGFRITIKGQGGHGAYPEATVDAVVIGAQIVQAIQQIVSRRIPAIEPAVVTIGAIHSSSIRGNVISDKVELLGTIRSFSEEIRKTLIKEVDRVCSIARALGGDYETEYEMGYPATVNDPKVTEIMRKAAVDMVGPENVIAIPLKTWAEDFSMLAQAAPGCFMFLGGEIHGDRRAHHSPNFDLDESGLYIGPAILAETAKRLMLQS
jgi:amidohydrolase